MAGQLDWRLVGQENYLKGATLCWKRYQRHDETWDHDHCAFCWAKFAVEDYPETLHEGYVTLDDYHWICERCFEDFKDAFEWQVVKS